MKFNFKNIWLVLVLGFFFTFSSVLASETKIPLFTATSNSYEGTLEINLTVDQDSNATGFLYTIDGKDTKVAIADLASGIVLYQMNGKDVAVLTSQSFNPSSGGPLTLTYLNDGLRNIYRNFNFSLARQGQNWNSYVMDSHGIPKVFITMYLTAKKLFGKIIGIDHISVN